VKTSVHENAPNFSKKIVLKIANEIRFRRKGKV